MMLLTQDTKLIIPKPKAPRIKSAASIGPRGLIDRRKVIFYWYLSTVKVHKKDNSESPDQFLDEIEWLTARILFYLNLKKIQTLLKKQRIDPQNGGNKKTRVIL